MCKKDGKHVRKRVQLICCQDRIESISKNWVVLLEPFPCSTQTGVKGVNEEAEVIQVWTSGYEDARLAGAWRDCFLSRGLAGCKCLLPNVVPPRVQPASCLKERMLYVGRGGPGVIILSGWCWWLGVELAGAPCPVTAAVTYKVPPFFVPKSCFFHIFFPAALLKQGYFSNEYFVFLTRMHREGFCSGQKAEECHREL